MKKATFVIPFEYMEVFFRAAQLINYKAGHEVQQAIKADEDDLTERLTVCFDYLPEDQKYVQEISHLYMKLRGQTVAQ